MTIDEKAFQQAMLEDDYGKPKSSDGRYSRQKRFVEKYEAAKAPVSLIDCAMSLQGNQRIKLGSDLQQIAKTVLDAAGVKYE